MKYTWKLGSDENGNPDNQWCFEFIFKQKDIEISLLIMVPKIGGYWIIAGEGYSDFWWIFKPGLKWRNPDKVEQYIIERLMEFGKSLTELQKIESWFTD